MQKGVGGFFSEVKAELVKVSWPKKEDVVKMTGLVIIVSVLTGFYVGTLDLIFTKTMEVVLK